MLTSSDSCSMMLVMSRVSRKTLLAALLTSTVWPSPLALTTVFSGTRKESIMTAAIVARASQSRKSPGNSVTGETWSILRVVDGKNRKILRLRARDPRKTRVEKALGRFAQDDNIGEDR